MELKNSMFICSIWFCLDGELNAVQKNRNMREQGGTDNIWYEMEQETSFTFIKTTTSPVGLQDLFGEPNESSPQVILFAFFKKVGWMLRLAIILMSWFRHKLMIL